MQVIIVESADDVGALVASHIAATAASGALKVLGVATGSSPVPVYRALARLRSPHVAALSAFALDEYVALPKAHPESYHSVIARDVTVPLGMDPSRVHVPDGTTDDPDAAAVAYEGAIERAGGVDVQLVGIGSTGHIGFNEPTSSFRSRTRIKTLTPDTRADNARFFASPDDVPLHCITQGLGTIMDAREVVLVAHGQSKAAAVALAVEGPLSSMCPASVLQMHRSATVVVDRAAASALQRADYYRYVFENRPRPRSWL